MRLGYGNAGFIVACALFLAAWQLVSGAGFWPSYVFPTPAGVFGALAEGASGGAFTEGVLASMKRMLVGFGAALAIGGFLGVLMSQSRALRDSLGPAVLGLQTLPSICWLPLAVLWFGLSEKAVIFVVLVGAVWSVTMAISSGVGNVPPLFINAARTMGARGWALYSEVIIPAALPSIASGVKQGWSFAWRSLMAGELIYYSAGLGQLLQMGRELNDVNMIAAVMAVIVCIGLIAERAVFGRLEESVRKKWGLETGS
ncbi:MAG TPA: ABC transporter permease [Candidatus Bilamarchaeum sp.]|nr:ABC transporter permease [Candidatus Bilamarchaeum sp.]